MATYKTIHTTYGLQKMAAAEASGAPIVLVAMAVGDGNGNAVSPSESQDRLVREVYRNAVNRVYQDQQSPTKYTAEFVIPAAIGGFTMREVGIFDADGGLFAVANLPSTYKPNDSDGAYSDTVLRMEFLVSNSGVVTLIIDPNVTIATHTWIANNVTLAQLAPGGTLHQILRKRTNADGDTEWADPGSFNVLVSSIEEEQSLVGGQTEINLVNTTTAGLSVYIEGVRLPRKSGVDGWQPHATIPTRAVLGRPYPGAKVICSQNEPNSKLVDPLARSSNLGDVLDKAAARLNLDVFSRAESAQFAPVGQVSFFARSSAPSGWLKANGGAISRTVYASLFSTIGTLFGAGDGFNTFNLPDLRGEFLRGLDDGRSADPGRSLGSFQGWQNAEHAHTGQTDSAGGHQHTIPTFARNGSANGYTGDGGTQRTYTSTTDAAGDHRHAFTTDAAGGNESRPRNIALLACVKY